MFFVKVFGWSYLESLLNSRSLMLKTPIFEQIMVGHKLKLPLMARFAGLKRYMYMWPYVSNSSKNSAAKTG